MTAVRNKEENMKEADLKKMTVKQLRELATEKTDLTGLSGMKKEMLVKAMIDKLGVDSSKKVAGEALKNKQAAKKEIVRLKRKKQELLKFGAKKNPQQLRNIRRRARSLKRHLRKI